MDGIERILWPSYHFPAQYLVCISCLISCLGGFFHLFFFFPFFCKVPGTCTMGDTVIDVTINQETSLPTWTQHWNVTFQSRAQVPFTPVVQPHIMEWDFHSEYPEVRTEVFDALDVSTLPLSLFFFPLSSSHEFTRDSTRKPRWTLWKKFGRSG